MAGWSVVADKSTIDRCCKTTPKKQLLGDQSPNSKGFSVKEKKEPAKPPLDLFHRLLKCFLREFSSSGTFRPLPPITGNGKALDLLRLFLVVIDKGGCEAVSGNKLWGFVANECGLGSELVVPVKLVYVKYLYVFERWLNRVFKKESSGGKKSGGVSMELEGELECFLSEMKKRYDKGTGEKPVESAAELKCFLSGIKVGYEVEFPCVSAVKKTEDLSESSFEEKPSPRKRKRESNWEMLNWVTEVAKNPCNLAIGALPEISKWESYGREELWRQVLLFRKAVSQRRNFDSPPDKYGQKNQKVHPCMYDDHTGSSYNLRERISCSSEKRVAKPDVSSGKDSLESDDEEVSNIPIGSDFQAEVPEWTGKTLERDSKWLGTRVWPLGERPNRLLIERDPIGKGRQDSCGCETPGSIECVRFHVSEKRAKLKLELASAFHHWGFDKMGEEVERLCWTNLEQRKVKAMMKMNPPSLNRSFFEQMGKILSTKTRADLVSYFYNVILLQYRAKQNRSSPTNISSDDEETEVEPVADCFTPEMNKSPKSILLTPKKSNTRVG